LVLQAILKHRDLPVLLVQVVPQVL
jgi:hypothetical protein